MPVTLKDVAKMANVTPTVVSRVLHNKASTVRVSTATAERVRIAAAQLGYRVNVMARNFRDRQTRTLGVLNGRGVTRPIFAHGPRYFATLMDGIIDSAFDHQFSVTLCPLLLGDHPEDAVNDGRFDGLLWYSIDASQETMEALENCAIPIVIIHAHAAAFGNRFPTVIADNRQGLGLAVDHLVERGHSKIGFAIETDAMNVESLERLEGFRFHMLRVGLPVSEEDILNVGVDRAELLTYLTQESLPHTAIIVHADGLAAEMIVLAQKQGHRVPEDLAIVGFDSTDFCDEIQPTLTSIYQPLYELGATATNQLMTLIGGKPVDDLELTLPCRLDIRGSTTPSPRE
jgi:LacI family transcriptional regulator